MLPLCDHVRRTVLGINNIFDAGNCLLSRGGSITFYYNIFAMEPCG